MLKETETEETLVFFVTFLSLVAFQFGGPSLLIPPPPPPPATHMFRTSALGTLFHKMNNDLMTT